MKPKIFDIESPEELLDLVEHKFKLYCEAAVKAPEDILFIIMIVNHLREWIAPGYKPKKDGTWPNADSPEKCFSQKVFKDTNFEVIRNLCNGTKHAKKMKNTGTKYEPNLFAWPNLFAVRNIFMGVPTSYLVDGQPIENYVKPILDMYLEWFRKSTDSS
jgi:hypothetical protein